MKIIEQTVVGKKSDPGLCEDGLFINEDFIAVVDGATAKGTYEWEYGKTSGVVAKEIILDYLGSVPRDISPTGLLNEITNRIYEKIIVTGLKDSKIDYSRASIIIYSRYHNEIWNYGDCQCMVNGNSYKHKKKIDNLLSELRSFVIQSLIINGTTEEELRNKDLGREFILPFLKQQHLFENLNDEYGYPVLNGESLNLDLMQTYQVEVGDEVVLATDGYPKLYPNLEESEKALLELLERDSLCYKDYKSTKGLGDGELSFDDRTYVRFKV